MAIHFIDLKLGAFAVGLFSLNLSIVLPMEAQVLTTWWGICGAVRALEFHVLYSDDSEGHSIWGSSQASPFLTRWRTDSLPQCHELFDNYT